MNNRSGFLPFIVLSAALSAARSDTLDEGDDYTALQPERRRRMRGENTPMQQARYSRVAPIPTLRVRIRIHKRPKMAGVEVAKQGCRYCGQESEIQKCRPCFRGTPGNRGFRSKVCFGSSSGESVVDSMMRAKGHPAIFEENAGSRTETRRLNAVRLKQGLQYGFPTTGPDGVTLVPEEQRKQMAAEAKGLTYHRKHGG